MKELSSRYYSCRVVVTYCSLSNSECEFDLVFICLSQRLGRLFAFIQRKPSWSCALNLIFSVIRKGAWKDDVALMVWKEPNLLTFFRCWLLICFIGKLLSILIFPKFIFCEFFIKHLFCFIVYFFIIIMMFKRRFSKLGTSTRGSGSSSKTKNNNWCFAANRGTFCINMCRVLKYCAYFDEKRNKLGLRKIFF